MADLKEKAISLMASVAAVDLDAANGTEASLFTVPAGLTFCPVLVVLHTFSAACGTAIVTFGITGGSCDEFLGDQTLTNVSGTGDFLICMPVPAATPVKIELLTAAQVFAVEITTKEGSALTCTMDPYGYLF